MLLLLSGKQMITTAQKQVWIDTDITIGRKTHVFSYCDVDDGYALAALLRAAEVEVTGISSTLGNTEDIEISTEVARSFIASYGPASLQVYRGSPTPLAQYAASPPLPEAVKVLAETLRTRRLTLLCLGAATNIALLLQRFPEIEPQIEEIVLVAGRQSVDTHFISGHWQPKPFRDLNFESDPEAFAILLNSSVPLTLVPFETCNQVWIHPEDLYHLEKANKVGRFLASHSLGWLAEWETVFGCNGFNPFDLVAAGYVLFPEQFTSKPWNAVITTARDDTGRGVDKPYLICSPEVAKGRPVTYLTSISPSCKSRLMTRISTHDMAAFTLGLSHINVVVNDIDEATEFYQRVLGFTQAIDSDGNVMDYAGVTMKSFALNAGMMDGEALLDVRFLHHPQAGIYLELMRYTTPAGQRLLPPQPKTCDTGGPRHIALEVSNCREVFDFLRQQEGVTMISSDPSYHPVKLDGFPISFFYWIDKYGIQWEMEEGRRVGVARGIV